MVPYLIVLLAGCPPWIPFSEHDGGSGVRDTSEQPRFDDTGGSMIDTEDPGEQGFYSCIDESCTLRGPVVGFLAIEASQDWLFEGTVFIGSEDSPGQLVIDSGTRVRMAAGSALVVRDGSSLRTEGAQNAPVVFTSSLGAGSRSPGDWRGIAIFGAAPISGCSGDPDPCTQTADGLWLPYGGGDATSGSSLLEYTRIEFAGGGDMSALSLYGTGTGVSVSGLQVHRTADDGVEIFGGTSQLYDVLVTDAVDDGLDWTNGWTGGVQGLIVHLWPGRGDHGIEADNVPTEPGLEDTPVSEPSVDRVSLIGDGSAQNDGIRTRLGTYGHFTNVIVSSFGNACLNFTDEAPVQRGDISISGSVIYSCGIEGPLATYSQTAWNAGVNNAIDNPWFVDLTPTSPDYKLTSDSAARRRGVARWGESSGPTDSGAINNDDDWTEGWTSFPEN